MKDFFISRTGVDSKIAKWIAHVLEENGYTTIIQDWDFKPGDNLVGDMDDALKLARRLIVVLSNAYLYSSWCSQEWYAMLYRSVETHKSLIVPIRVEPVDVTGLLGPLIYIDITNRTEEDATRLLLDGVRDGTDRRNGQYFPNNNVDIISVENEYFVEDGKIMLIKTCHCRALLDGFESQDNQITWYPDEAITVTALYKEQYIQVNAARNARDTNFHYDIYLGHKLKAGEEFSFKVKAEMTDRHKRFKNFFSTEIRAPIRRLKVSVHFGDNVDQPSKIMTQKIYKTVANYRTEKAAEHMYTNSFVWEVEPELDFEYKIWW